MSMVLEDLTRNPQLPAVRCDACGGALGGLRLIAAAGIFVHADPASCRRRHPRPGANGRPLTSQPIGEQ